MKFKYLAALIACTVTHGALLSPVFAQDVKNINKWFDDIQQEISKICRRSKTWAIFKILENCKRPVRFRTLAISMRRKD